MITGLAEPLAKTAPSAARLAPLHYPQRGSENLGLGESTPHQRGGVAGMQRDIELETTGSSVEPQLDEALCDLCDRYRDVVLLRFFNGKSAREIAEVYSISEDAAQRRVNRAIERLRRIFERRGVSLAAQSLAGELFHPFSRSGARRAPLFDFSRAGNRNVHNLALFNASQGVSMK